jgi:crotonobetainyl-CoA:carnitine CoA-transferase CaiB-like acyl-CoA transferase
MDGRRLPNRYDPPGIGEHSGEILNEIGMSPNEIEALRQAGTIKVAPS